MKIVSWNLNGLVACIKNGVMDAIGEIAPDILCLQEIRTQQEPVILGGYRHFWNHGLHDGYSGTAVLAKHSPVQIFNDFPDGYNDTEGRLITAEFSGFYVINVYVPNSQRNLKRHAYRLSWDAAFRSYAAELMEDKPIIIGGDFNVARDDIDIYAGNMRQYWAEQGYISDERSNFETLLEQGLTDTFRALHPEERSYTWWSNRLNKRSENRGWRLDYFLVSDNIMPSVRSVRHLQNIMGSDHCPIELEVEL